MIKYSYLTHRWGPKSSISPGQNEPWNDSYEKVLNIPQSPTDAFLCHTLDTRSWVLPLIKGKVVLLYSPTQ